MANNNYAGFSYGGTQYNSAGAAPGYNPGQVYPAVTNATYNNAAAYQSAAVVAGQGGYAAGGAAAPAGYGGYGDYGRAITSYDATKTFYQQAPASYNPAPAAAVSKTHYSAPPVKNLNQNVKAVNAGTAKDKNAKANANANANAAIAAPTVAAAAAAAAASTVAATGGTGYTNYDAALYSAASMYVAQQQQSRPLAVKPNGSGGPNSWGPYRNMKGGGGPGGAGAGRGRMKQSPRPQQLHYCDVCKISCAGPQTYREHLEGQKHKKREASLKLQASAQNTSQNRGNNYHCELCDVTCTGTDAYAAHVRGSKHQKVVKLHQKLGKPIPSDEPKKLLKIHFVAAGTTNTMANTNAAAAAAAATAGGAGAPGSSGANNNSANVVDGNAKSHTEETQADNDICMQSEENDIKPVGGQYIEEIKDEDSKILSFNCKLCDCKFNDPNAKEMHMKGRRHRLQYKRKVQPDLVVDFKPTPRQRRLAEARAQRALMQAHRGMGGYPDDHEAGMYWDEQRRRAQYDDEYDYSNWLARSFAGQQRGFGGRMMGNAPPPFFGMLPGGANMRRPDSTDDRHAIAKHADIYPKEEELQNIQRIVSHTERALKFVSDALAENPGDIMPLGSERSNQGQMRDGRDNQMLSFQNNADVGNVRMLKGVMRVGYLAKGLLLHGDKVVELVVLCSEKPTVGLLKRVATELPLKLAQVLGEGENEYTVEMVIEDSALLVSNSLISVKISLTSPLLREPGENASNQEAGESEATNDAMEDGIKQEVDSEANTSEKEPANLLDTDMLPREPCLKALAELRHAKWFQARATGLQSCVMVIRILRDLCRRVPVWNAMPQWSLELFVEKVISSAGFPIPPGDCLRRIMEALASGFLINGPGLLDPCEKEPQDALEHMKVQQREDLTLSAQLFLRYIAFRQIYKVLSMRQLPAMKYSMRPWRVNRKRRRSNGAGPVKSGATSDAPETEAGGTPSEKMPKKEAIES